MSGGGWLCSRSSPVVESKLPERWLAADGDDLMLALARVSALQPPGGPALTPAY